MAIDVTPEQRETGRENYARTTDGLTRRGFMKSMVIAGAAVVPVSAAYYFGYRSLDGNPVKTALIGGGDEGGVLVGEHNPAFLQFIAVCDIRPTNMKRIFDGDPKTPLRKGFKKVYGSEANGIKKYTDYREMLLNNKDIEAVVIAVPLHLHAKVAIDAMRIGKERGKPIHVLTEKLMAWNITQCKQMIKVADETGSCMSVGHQRHYSMLYAHAVEVVKAGTLGDIKHIRALWHRNNTWDYEADPKDAPTVYSDPKLEHLKPRFRDGWYPAIYKEDYDALNDPALLKKYGFESVEQLVRWRLYNATGGGLMAELGSHQLDACSIFLGHVHPLAVSAVGGKFFYGPGRNDRQADDHVFVTYEYPGKNYANDKNDIVVVTYSSISTNQFEPYGECVMGSRGTMIVSSEQEVMIYSERDPNKKGGGNVKSMTAGVTNTGRDKPVVEASPTWGGPAATPTGSVAAGGTNATPVSRGYREEMEDFAYCIRMWNEGYAKDRRLPRCHGRVAMADAIVALTANLSMKRRQRIVFEESWFDAASQEVPDAEMKPMKEAEVEKA
jgi:predicted dehydrogenase